MDDKLTAISSSTVENVGGEGSDTLAFDSCRETFDKAFPSYLAMGMSYDEFYKKDHTLAIAYRRAYKQKRDNDNFEKWLMGLYVYHAVSKVAPLLIPFNKHPKAELYLDKPLPIYGNDGDDEENAKSKAVFDKGFAFMQAQMSRINKKFGGG